MLRFIDENVNIQISGIEFQYISCYGLSNKHLFSVCILPHFNTSHVTVFPPTMDLSSIQTSNFNTSHVTVYRTHRQNMAFNKLDFNTSHVTVYPCHPDLCSRSIHISIHLMLRFIVTKLDHRKVETNFNTSHVTVYLCRCVCWLWPDNISIHLMLRFILFDIFS